MRKIVDKIPLLLCCCMLSGKDVGFVFSTVSFLVAVSVTSLCQYCQKGRISFFAEAAYIAACFVFSELVYFLPLIIYDILFEKRYYFCIAAGIAFLSAAINRELVNIPFFLVCTVIGVVLWKKTSSLEELEKKYISSRDSFAEVNMLLSEKNRHLHERQDYEIRLATLKERNRIAREIHDNVGHLLSRSILQVGALQITAKEDFQKDNLQSLSETLNNAMNSVRKSVHDLHDESVDLKQAVDDAVKPLREKGLGVNTDYSVTEEIPNKIKLCFISIIKEGISNIVKHSTADNASIIIREHPAFYQLMIEDNGSCCEKISDGGIGLSNMRDRVEDLGGIITFNSSKNGFKIFISIKK